MNLFERLERLEQRIAELRAGAEIDAKHINVLLSKERQQEFDGEWQRQQQLRKVSKPASLNTSRYYIAKLRRCRHAVRRQR